MGTSPLEGHGAARVDGLPFERTSTLRPLRIRGIVVRKVDLIDALRIYAPVADLEVTEDGEHFWLMLSEGEQDEDSPSK